MSDSWGAGSDIRYVDTALANVQDTCVIKFPCEEALEKVYPKYFLG